MRRDLVGWAFALAAFDLIDGKAVEFRKAGVYLNRQLILRCYGLGLRPSTAHNQFTIIGITSDS